MLSPELLKKIQQIYITSRYLANDVFSGEYATAFRGRGMEFEEVREYTPGDDIRIIDWNVTARTSRPYVKIFREEREQTVMLLVDGSSSENFGSVKRTKRELVAEIAALLAYAAIKSNDKVGLIIFTDTVERFIPPKKGKSHVWRVISEILSFKPQGKKTNIGEALHYMGKVVNRRSVTFVLSDFMAPEFEKEMKIARCKHDLIALKISDPLEEEFKTGGLMTFEDLETGSLMTVDLSSPSVRRAFFKMREKEDQKIRSQFQSMNMDTLFLKTNEDYMGPLLRFFRMRENRL